MLSKELCPVCNEKPYWVTGLKAETGEPYDVYQCSNCYLLFIPSTQIASDKLASFYNKDFYEEKMCDSVNPQRETVQQLCVETLLNSLEKYISTPGRMLDVGCGDGIHLKLFHGQGWEVKGTEISKFAAEYVRSRYNFEVFRGELTDVPFEDNHFNFIQMKHVIEHLSDPMPSLKKVWELLNPMGILRIDTPTIGLLDKWMPIVNTTLKPLVIIKRRLEGRSLPEIDHSRFGNLHPPEHNLLFTKSAMREALKRAGFEILSLRTTFRGDPRHYPSKFALGGVKRNWWEYVWLYVDILGAKLGWGSILIVYAQKNN